MDASQYYFTAVKSGRCLALDKHKVVLWPRDGVCVLVGGRVRTSDVFVETFFDVIGS